MSVNIRRNNIDGVIKAGLCIGCGTCVSICPTECIQIVEDNKSGMYIPKINEEKCINCGLCLKVCPGLSVDFDLLNKQVFQRIPIDELLGNYINCYIGYATDYAIRYNSSSGGLVTALLCFMLEENIIDYALVTLMDKENPLRPKVIIATTKEEIIAASGSKYCPVPLNASLRKLLNSSGRSAIVGLPCHIHGIRKIETINKGIEEKMYHFGLFCANLTSFLGTEYFLARYGIKKEDVISIRYRSEGWPGMISVVTRSGVYKICRGPVEKNTLRRAIYYSAFHYDFIPYRCLVCPDQTNELADISFGDAWLPELLNKESAGFSIVISRTKKGQKILDRALRKGVIKLTKINRSTLLRAGNFYFKASAGSRINLSKYLGKPVPHFVKGNLRLQADIIDLIYFSQYFPSFFSKNRRIWSFLPAIALLRRCMSTPLAIVISTRRRREK